MSTKINLFQEYYVPKDEKRAREVDFCFVHNSALQEINYYIIVHSEEEAKKISSLLPSDSSRVAHTKQETYFW
ncbi:Hypothetical protein BRZCDTV_205 [Brazilian cedratvirus IHUMI]|uniref:Uncharacterized protein n=1 Tax=Brazilian cedratvirus IHUMI TaxID=2126980 RepID=A0A2R8FDW0_9VIRU|nr:Hypothetical protein BRZCDTV_205 [Brazilian cedratvirus IHUMI]